MNFMARKKLILMKSVHDYQIDDDNNRRIIFTRPISSLPKKLQHNVIEAHLNFNIMLYEKIELSLFDL